MASLRLTYIAGLPSAAVLAVALAGCGSDTTAGADNVGYMPDDLPAGQCRDTDDVVETDGDTDGSCPDTDDTAMAASGTTSTTGGSSESTAGEDACLASEECEGAICAAGFDPEAEERTPFGCVFGCLNNLDEGQWCSDDAACCDPDAICTKRGYCAVVAE